MEATFSPSTCRTASRPTWGIAFPDEAPPWAHLIGAAGSGMKSLAALLEQAGWKLSGCDPRAAISDGNDETARPEWLTCDDLEPLDGDIDLLIYSTAVGPDHSQRAQAARCGIPSRSYPQMLAELMAGKQGLAVAGTHGKSTTTAMLAQCLRAAGGDPSVVFGADWLDGAPGGRFGSDETVVVEACEYRGAFLSLAPQAAAILNVEWDHVDCFATIDRVEETFRRFVRQLPTTASLVVNADCPRTAALDSAARCRVVAFGTTSAADYRYEVSPREGPGNGLRLWHSGRLLGQAQLAVPGRHQAVCAAAAAALALEWGAAWRDVQRGLENFTGLRRRLEFLGTHGGVDVWDDYAHHPTAVTAALRALRTLRPDRRLVCIFEPHQESRLAAMLDEFAASLHNADLVGVTPVFRARETQAAAPSDARRRLVAQLAAQRLPATALESGSPGIEKTLELLSPGDVLVALGAGDVRRLAHDIVERLGGNRPAE